MIKKFILPLLAVLLTASVLLFAQDKPKANYAPGREQLAEKTFRELVPMIGGISALALAGDLEDCMKAIADYPDLKTAVYENIIFDFCNIADSLKTDENRRAESLAGISYFTLKNNDDWNALGERYVAARLQLEADAKAR